MEAPWTGVGVQGPMAIVTGPQRPAAGAWRSHGSPLCLPGQEALGAPHTRQTQPRASALSVSAHQGADFLLFFPPLSSPISLRKLPSARGIAAFLCMICQSILPMAGLEDDSAEGLQQSWSFCLGVDPHWLPVNNTPVVFIPHSRCSLTFCMGKLSHPRQG